jgi:hypothetical protein
MRFKFKYLAAAMLAVPLCSPAFAEEQKPQPAAAPAQGQMGDMSGMGGMMGGMGMSEEHLKQKQDFMLKMHEYANKILAAKDGKEREQLKEEQRKLMREHMEVHHRMMREHMQQMMQHGGQRPMQPGQPMQHGGGMGDMQHGGQTPPPASPPPAAPAPQAPAGH